MLDRLVSILPASQQDRAKAWVAWLGTVAALLTLVIPDAPSWLTAGIAVLTALGVYKAPNIGYVKPAAEQRIAPFVGQAPAGKRTPGGLAIWGVILALAGIVEVWGITNAGADDTLSEFTRWIFDTDGSGALVFGIGWAGFAGWFLWHILGGKAKRQRANRARPNLDAPGFIRGMRDADLNDVETHDPLEDGRGDEDYRTRD